MSHLLRGWVNLELIVGAEHIVSWGMSTTTAEEFLGDLILGESRQVATGDIHTNGVTIEDLLNIRSLNGDACTLQDWNILTNEGEEDELGTDGLNGLTNILAQHLQDTEHNLVLLEVLHQLIESTLTRSSESHNTIVDLGEQEVVGALLIRHVLPC